MLTKSTKTTFLVLTFLFLCLRLTAQNQGIEFVYDQQTGNRIIRRVITLINTDKKSDSLNTSKEVVKYDDLFNNIKVTIYPNPNGGRFKVKLNGLKNNQKAIIYLTTMTGEIIFKKNYFSDILEINIENKRNGAYILYLDINGKQKSWKILKL